MVMFQSREEAGMLLAEHFTRYKKREKTLVCGIPRGGVVVANVVARKLSLPLDIVVVRKIGAPHNPELAIGAVASQNTVYWDEDLCGRLGMNRSAKFKMKNEKLGELRERERILRGKRRPRSVKGKTVLLIDDGVATGATVIAARESLKKRKVATVVLGVPAVSRETLRDIEYRFDRLVGLHVPEEFYAVGQFYEEFPQVSDEEVRQLLSYEANRWTR